MSNQVSEGWQELQTVSRRECPKLFFSFVTSRDAFKLLLTDLIAIWQCTMDKYDIIAEASRQHSSIDPAESSSQLQVLLSKLRQSLQDGSNELAREPLERSQRVVLRTTMILPRPLKALVWTFRLATQSTSDMAEQILRPSLHEVSTSQRKIDSLHRSIKEKDHVISRLLDRIGNSAVDLSLIFPGITGVVPRKGQVTVPEAMKHVPGMAPFDEKAWLNRFANDDGYQGVDTTGLVNLVRGCEKCFAHTKEEHEDWISRLPSPESISKHDERDRQSEPRTNKAPPAARSVDESTSSEDDFDRQAPSPILPKKSPQGRPKVDSRTGSETDDTAQPPASKKARIGGLGRRKNDAKQETTSKQRSQSPKPIRQKKPAGRYASVVSTSTNRSSSSEDAEPRKIASLAKTTSKLGSSRSKSRNEFAPARSPSPRTQASSSTPSTPSRLLGRLGSRRKQTTSPEPQTQPQSQPRSGTATPSRKLGRLGGRKPPAMSREEDHKDNDLVGRTNRNEDATLDTASTASQSPLPSATRKKPVPTNEHGVAAIQKSQDRSKETKQPSSEPPKEPETAEEMANRRREELKRTLDGKANARKKRRF